jgi:hypothetical protein
MRSISDIDVYWAAKLLISQHGDGAELVAARRADLLIDRDDCDGLLMWLRIMRAVAALQAPPIGLLQ